MFVTSFGVMVSMASATRSTHYLAQPEEVKQKIDGVLRDENKKKERYATQWRPSYENEPKDVFVIRKRGCEDSDPHFSADGWCFDVRCQGYDTQERGKVYGNDQNALFIEPTCDFNWCPPETERTKRRCTCSSSSWTEARMRQECEVGDRCFHHGSLPNRGCRKKYEVRAEPELLSCEYKCNLEVEKALRMNPVACRRTRGNENDTEPWDFLQCRNTCNSSNEMPDESDDRSILCHSAIRDRSKWEWQHDVWFHTECESEWSMWCSSPTESTPRAVAEIGSSGIRTTEMVYSDDSRGENPKQEIASAQTKVLVAVALVIFVAGFGYVLTNKTGYSGKKRVR